VETGLGIPFHQCLALRAAPPLLLFLEPRLNPYLPLAAEVFQGLGMVGESVVVEISDEGAGEVRAIGTAGDPRLLIGTLPYPAILAIRDKATLGETAIAIKVIQGHAQLRVVGGQGL